MVMSGPSDNLTTLSMVRLKPRKGLTGTKCTYFHQKLTKVVLESAEGVVGSGLAFDEAGGSELGAVLLFTI